MHARGYSLIELVVVLAVIGTAAAIAAPRFAEASVRYRLDAAGARVEADVRAAQRAARASGEPVLVRFSLLEDTYRVGGLVDSGGTPTFAAAGATSVRPAETDLADAPYGVDLAGASFGGNAWAAIDAWGELEHRGTIRLRLGAAERIVEVGQ